MAVVSTLYGISFLAEEAKVFAGESREDPPGIEYFESQRGLKGSGNSSALFAMLEGGVSFQGEIVFDFGEGFTANSLDSHNLINLCKGFFCAVRD